MCVIFECDHKESCKNPLICSGFNRSELSCEPCYEEMEREDQVFPAEPISEEDFQFFLRHRKWPTKESK